MKITVQPKERTFELTEEQAKRLKEIAHGQNYYLTSGEDADRLDEIEQMGLVWAQYGGGGDEKYRITEMGRLVFQELNSSQREVE